MVSTTRAPARPRAGRSGGGATSAPAAPRCKRRGDEVVPVDGRALQRDEQIARLHVRLSIETPVARQSPDVVPPVAAAAISAAVQSARHRASLPARRPAGGDWRATSASSNG